MRSIKNQEKRNLTDAFVHNELSAPEGRNQRIVYDSKQAGLYVRALKSGGKSFYVRKTIGGNTSRLFLAKCSDVSVKQAREMAAIKIAQSAQAENPLEAFTSQASKPTLNNFFSRFSKEHLIHNKTHADYERVYEQHIKPKFGTLKLHLISRDMLNKHHKSIGEKVGHSAANKMLAVFSSIMNTARAWSVYSGENPCVGIKKYHETSRDRFLEPDKISAFIEAVQAMPNTTIRDYVCLSLLTGARKSDVLSMEWSQIDFASSTWRIPLPKNKEPQRVVLSAIALNILAERKKTVGDSPFVFPSDRGSASGHLEEPKKAWKKMLENAGIEDFRIHDLRRTLGSYMTMEGASEMIVGKALGHKSQAATRIYARLNLDPVRKSVDSVSELFKGLERPTP